MLSPLAVSSLAFGLRPAAFMGERKQPIAGVTLHTTGSGILRKASAKTPEATLLAAVKYYVSSGGPTYVIGWDGTIVATAANEALRTWHSGVTDSGIRSLYQQGDAWMKRATPAAAQIWRERWPGARSPFDLIPDSNDANSAFVGIEMIPVTDGAKQYHEPMRPGLKFSKAQHDAARRLVEDIGTRNLLPPGWKKTHRLNGHFDLNPLERMDAGGGWDPGDARRAPFFDMEYVRGGGLGVLVSLALAGFVAWGAHRLLAR